jgi:hypothetical protein
MEEFYEVARLERPRVKPRVKRLVKVAGHDRFVGVLVCEKGWGFATHWDGVARRTLPCNGDKKICDGCVRKLVSKEMWVIELWSVQTRFSVFVQLTPQAYDQLLCDVMDGSLRGLHVQMQRKSKAPKQPILIDILGRFERPDELPVPSDPKPSLYRVWGLD